MDRYDITKINIHTSEHANPIDLLKMAIVINPHKMAPIHTFFPERNGVLFHNVKVHKNGE